MDRAKVLAKISEAAQRFRADRPARKGWAWIFDTYLFREV